MHSKEDLQKCINMLARRVPALAGAQVIQFGNTYEVWMNPYVTMVVGSYGTIMLWLGCVAVTKRVRRYDLYPANVLHAVIGSAQVWGII